MVTIDVGLSGMWGIAVAKFAAACYVWTRWKPFLALANWGIRQVVAECNVCGSRHRMRLGLTFNAIDA
jgi:hypothetical protein